MRIGTAKRWPKLPGPGGKTWRAYLSTQGQGAVNARDRIGQGPWYSHGGRSIAKNLSELHGDTLAEARNGNVVNKVTAVAETGEQVNGVGDQPNKHDILTGSQQDGRAYTDGEDHTCSNWTNNDEGSAQVGHHDRTSPGNISWNSSHPSRGCSQENLQSSWVVTVCSIALRLIDTAFAGGTKPVTLAVR